MKFQYRISGDGMWAHNFGYAFMAIVNPSGSGRKLTIRSLEIFQQQIAAYVSGYIGATPIDMFRCPAPLVGRNMVACAARNDSSVAIPSEVVVRSNATPSSYGSNVGRREISRKGAAAGTSGRVLLGTHQQFGKYGGVLSSPTTRGSGLVEGTLLRQNEGLVGVVPHIAVTLGLFTGPCRVSISVAVAGKTINWQFHAVAKVGQGLFSIENTGAAVVTVLRIGIAEIGTTDTPAIRLVPIGQLVTEDTTDPSKAILDISKMDSTSPDLLSSVCAVYSDIGFIPLGVPAEYISQASQGTPKGLNYLHTKDFVGPTLRMILPEYIDVKGASGATSRPDSLGHSYGHRNADIFARRAGFVVNPGEGLALVSSAETAVGVQAAWSGWPSLSFAAQVDNEPQASPYLTLTNLVSGSDIVVLTAGTMTVINSVDSYGGSSYAWNYDPDVVTSVDICVYRQGSVPFILRNIALGLSGASIPVSQSTDRNYI